jgi:hypothetical protein
MVNVSTDFHTTNLEKILRKNHANKYFFAPNPNNKEKKIIFVLPKMLGKQANSLSIKQLIKKNNYNEHN